LTIDQCPGTVSLKSNKDGGCLFLILFFELLFNFFNNLCRFLLLSCNKLVIFFVLFFPKILSGAKSWGILSLEDPRCKHFKHFLSLFGDLLSLIIS
jgi:hypothetical protein